MFNIENPVRDGHWAQKNLPAFMAGSLPNSNYTIIRVGGKIVGKVEDGIFQKKVKGSIHFLHIPPAIAFDISSLEQAELAGAILVKVVDKETGKKYRAYLSTIWNKGFKLSRGYGEQIALSLSMWCIGDEPLNEQLSLWRQL